MYKILIVDDEPLVQVGIKSMLNRPELNIEVIGTATNGQIALNMIQENAPDIVITDIKMPVMSGLELIRECRKRYGNEHPHFIILTSYEDFHMVKEAITYQVTDYLVKLELTPQTLSDAIQRAMEQINRTRKTVLAPMNHVYPFHDKFFIRLLNNLFESEEQFSLQSKELNLSFRYQGYVCCYGEMSCNQAEHLPMERQLALFSTSMQMLQELSTKYCPCHSLSLDTRHFALIFCFRDVYADSWTDTLKDVLQNIFETIKNYYNVLFRCGIGNYVDNPLSICDSYQYSRQAFQNTDLSKPLLYFEDCISPGSRGNSFNISLFKADLIKAFEEYDPETLNHTFQSLCELFLAHPNRHVQALDCACNILFLAISLLPDGEKIVSDFFEDNPDGYRCVYKLSNVEQIVNWLNLFEQKLCALFEAHRRDYKNHIVANVKKYILAHVTQHLSLNEVAAVFGISPNYLSQLFGKYNDVGFSEYVNTCKINEGKRLLDEGNFKVYEVAEMLGFESSFYFSKVFKKVEGISPTEYVNAKYS